MPVASSWSRTRISIFPTMISNKPNSSCLTVLPVGTGYPGTMRLQRELHLPACWHGLYWPFRHQSGCCDRVEQLTTGASFLGKRKTNLTTLWMANEWCHTGHGKSRCYRDVKYVCISIVQIKDDRHVCKKGTYLNLLSSQSLEVFKHSYLVSKRVWAPTGDNHQRSMCSSDQA